MSMKTMTCIAAAIAALGLAGTAKAATYTSLSAWKTAVGGVYTNTTNFGTVESFISSATVDGKTWSFSETVQVGNIGVGELWLTWCCGYSGQVMFPWTGAPNFTIFDSLTVTTSSGIGAFGMFIEPQNLEPYDITLSVGGADLKQNVVGNAGALFFGYIGAPVTSFTISADPNASGFAFGDIYTAAGGGGGNVPEPGSLALLLAGALGAVAATRRRRTV